MSKSVVISPFFDWDNDRHPRTPYSETIIYEAHVKGLTQTHPGIPEDIRGTYAAVAHPVMIEHYKKIGVTAIELMPVHQFVHDSHLADRGMRNYWGYNTIGFFAPHNDYSSAGTRGQQVQEFKAMVKALHAEGLEVILDVVYNHTAEGNHMGPTLSFRGIDNANYYRLVDEDKRHYYDTTGTGNTLLMRSPHVLQLIMDSLRYWVTEMHVDGFRFDLASSLARQFHEVDRLSAFFDLVHQDPVVSQTKLIAEPWDVGYGGYNVGGFPPLWTEWNGKYRDLIRDYWRGEPETLAEFASRLTGSADLYQHDGRRPLASINFVTAHDGFTLHDLVSYNDKHNDANGEDGNDGESNNSSWNCGVEGETDDLEVVALREQQKRNFLTTLFLSQGVPMLLHGDELGRTQSGNNNVYAQDNELAWIDWERAKDYEVLTEFVARLSKLRSEHPVFRRRRFFNGRPVRGSAIEDIAWFTPTGEEMDHDDWDSGFAKSVTVFLNGDGIREPDARGERIVDDSFFLIFNGHHEPIEFTLPDLGAGERWQVEVDTAAPMLADVEAQSAKAGEPVQVDARSVQVLRKVF
jgi:glycogen operon protein